MECLALMPKYEAYKDSGVDWLGAIPAHWNSFPLCAKSKLKSISNNENEELLSVYLNKGVIKFDDVDAKRTNATSSDLTKYQLVEPGDFVLNNQQAWRGSVGVSDYRGIVSPAYLILSLSEDIVPRFGNYLFRDGAMVANYLVSSKGVGTIQRNLYWPQLKRALVFLPTTEEQFLIANYLDQKTAQIDDAIAIKEQQISLLKERKQIIIQQAVTQGLDPNVPMKDSGVDWIGKIPEHWEIRRAKYIFKKESRPVRLEDDVVTCFRDGQVTLRTNRRTEGFTFATKEHGYQGIRKGDLVIHAMDAFAGAIGVSDSDGKSSPVYSVCTPLTGVEANPKYYALYLRNLALGGFIESLAKGIRERSTDFRNKDFSELFFPLPDIETQNKVVLEIEKSHHEIDGGISFLAKQIENLKDYKATLINSAVTGKIKITPKMAES
tara:strand:+ start:17178 stop:18485 length:1308 start_codon:yes stop_codon:yes gene_type:complete